jgi:DNA-binding NtrC family response regulator
VGGLETYSIDVRFLSATNRDLEAEVDRGTFRKDLFFRLNGISFTIPPLRERAGEIEGLARDLLAEASRRAGRSAPAIGSEVLELFRVYPWPGNVRELRNVMERALVLCGDGAIGLAHVPVEKMSAHFGRRLQGPLPKPVAPGPRLVEVPPPQQPTAAGSLRSEVEAFERQRIVDALSACAGNQAEAAKILRISRRTLVKRLAAYDIPRPRKRASRGAAP